MLAVDLDWDFADIHGFVLRPSHSLLPAMRAARTQNGQVPAIIAEVDRNPAQRNLYNVGLMFVRSTPATIALARRSESRSFGGWEQGIFNEELNFNSDGVPCCYAATRASDCNLIAHLRKIDKVHDLGHQRRAADHRTRVEGPDQCSDVQPEAPPPPRRSPYIWARSTNETAWLQYAKQPRLAKALGGWATDGDNQLLIRAVGRCGRPNNTCLCTETHTMDDDAARVFNADRWLRILNRAPESVVVGDAFRRALKAANDSRKEQIRRGVRGVKLLGGFAANGSVSLRDWLASRPKAILI